jgi:ATP-dependent DNA ligase
VFLTTRTGKQWSYLGNLRKEIQTFLQDNEGVVLDGELYSHDLSSIGITGDGERFAFLQSCCKTGRVSPHEKEDLVEFHVFDVIGEGDQKTRFKVLDSLFENYKGDLIRKVRTEKVYNEEEFLALYGSFIAEGYEGIMLRDNQLKYEQGKRSQRIRKHKEFYDSEFLIVGAVKAEGNQEGCVVWICETEKGEKFQTTMLGSLEFRREMYENRDEYIGKLLKVRHQVPLEEIEEGVIPRFPVGLGVREDL